VNNLQKDTTSVQSRELQREELLLFGQPIWKWEIWTKRKTHGH